jgi:hypothetical protein
MTNDLRSLFSDSLAAPLGEVIESVGRGVAEAQAALDAASLQQTLALYEGSAQGDGLVERLRSIGYQPTFYALPETTCEVTVSLTVGGTGGPDGSAGSQRGSRRAAYITPVDASFANRYGFRAEASAKLSFRIVPVPPPTGVEDLRPVPALVGLKLSEAAAVVSALGLRLLALDGASEPVSAAAKPSEVVDQQSPVAGQAVRVGAEVVVRV